LSHKDDLPYTVWGVGVLGGGFVEEQPPPPPPRLQLH